VAARRPGQPASQKDLLSLLQNPGGRPPHVDDTVFDCAWRHYALQHAVEIQPWLTSSQLQQINDSLAFSTACTGVNYTPLDLPPPSSRKKHLPVPAPGLQPSACTGVCIFVDPVKGSDANSGTQASPLRTISAAVNATRSSESLSPTIILRNGTYFINATITLTPADSGLTITAFDGETPVISGGIPVVASWSPYNVSNSTSWGAVLVNENAVFGQCGIPGVPNMVRVLVFRALKSKCLLPTIEGPVVI
jgi:hypothetical protein